MEKKAYIIPVVEVVATDAEELLAGSVTLTEEEGSASLFEEVVDLPGM